MGEQFLHDIEREFDLAYIVENEVNCNTPILMCSVTGYDASGRVMDLAAQLGRQLTDIAIGNLLFLLFGDPFIGYRNDFYHRVNIVQFG